jgi:hypothetical protein
MKGPTARARVIKRVKSLYKRAFFNQYNLILLGGTALFALTTFSWLPLLVGGGLEVLWMVLGPDTTLFKRWVARQESREEQERLKKQAAEALEVLGEEYVNRFAGLQQLGEDIRQLADENPSLETSLIQDEMTKLGEMMHVFLQMAVLHQRLRGYLRENSETDIRRDMAQCEKAMRGETSREVQASLEQSLALAQKRMRQHGNIEASFKALSVKMDTLEKSFRYLKSHIVAIGTREELSNEIATLISGVESVETRSSETDDLLTDLRAATRLRVAAK